MDKVDLEGYQFFASPSDRALMSEILARLAALEERDRQREEEIASLKAHIAELERDHNEVADFNARERAIDRQRIAALEIPAQALSQMTATDHLDRLFSEMRRLGHRQTTTKDAARLMGISKDQAKKLKPYLATDSRFIILKDPHHKQRHLIRLSRV